MLEGRERKATRESRVDLSEKNLEGGVVRKKGHASRRYSDVRSASIRFRDMEAGRANSRCLHGEGEGGRYVIKSWLMGWGVCMRAVASDLERTG